MKNVDDKAVKEAGELGNGLVFHDVEKRTSAIDLGRLTDLMRHSFALLRISTSSLFVVLSYVQLSTCAILLFAPP